MAGERKERLSLLLFCVQGAIKLGLDLQTVLQVLPHIAG